MALLLAILVVGFTVSCLSGFLGIGGGIVMAPVLLYLLPLLGVADFGMREVSGLTITQALFACLSGAVRHNKYRSVNRRLVGWMGSSILLSALAGSLLSSQVSNAVLMQIFAGLAIVAAVLMCLPKKDDELVVDANAVTVHVPLAVAIAVAIGLLGGMVGQGGSFILIPLMLYVLRLPTRVAVGTNLALVFCASLAGFAGKFATGQIPLLPAAVLVAGAIPGAQLGSVFSRRTDPKWLRVGLAFIVGVAAVGITIDVVTHS